MKILNEDKLLFQEYLTEIENIKFLKLYKKHKIEIKNQNQKKRYQKMVKK
jgi:hypothetical protein